MGRPHLEGKWETRGPRDYWRTPSGRQLEVVGDKWKTIVKAYLEQTGIPLGDNRKTISVKQPETTG